MDGCWVITRDVQYCSTISTEILKRDQTTIEALWEKQPSPYY